MTSFLPWIIVGCYVHGAEITTLHRRAYHLLNPDTGTALYPVASSNNRNSMPSLVLVHYLDTKLASQHSANLMNNQNVNSQLSPAINYRSNISAPFDCNNDTCKISTPPTSHRTQPGNSSSSAINTHQSSKIAVDRL